MNYEKNLSIKLRKNLNKYFPNERLKLVKIKRVSELYKNKLESRTYKCILSGTRHRVVYIKYFSKEKIKTLKQIKKIKEFNKYRKKIKIPKIFDFYKDLNSIVIETAKGIELSKLFPLYFLPGIKKFHLKKIETIIKKIARAVVNLHNITKRGKGKQILTQSFNDLKLGNILFDGKQIKIIDFEMKRTNYMEDIISFITSLEMLEKFPFISSNDITKMKNNFLEEYSNNINWKINNTLFKEKEKKKRYEILKTLLNKNARRGTNLLDNIFINWNIRYLKNKLKFDKKYNIFKDNFLAD